LFLNLTSNSPSFLFLGSIQEYNLKQFICRYFTRRLSVVSKKEAFFFPFAQPNDSGLLVSLDPLPKALAPNPEQCSKVDQFQKPVSQDLPEDRSDEDALATLFTKQCLV